MNEFFKRMLESVKTLWGKWSNVQKLIVGGIAAAVLAGVVMLATFSSSTDMVRLFSTSVSDAELLDRISMRLDQEGITHQLDENVILVDNEKTAKRARSILVRENIMPKDISAWDFFNTGNRWTVTELENNVRIQQAITKTLETHLESLSEIDSAQVVLTFPEEKILASDQNPKKASVIISPRPGINMQEHNRIKGIENLVLFAVDGLLKENLTITDINGNLLNSNDEMIAKMNDLDYGKEQINYKLQLQNRYTNSLRQALESIYPDRVVIANLELDLNFDVEDYTENKILPTVWKEDNPLTPMDEFTYSEKVDVVTEKKRVVYAGTGVHPDGPAGPEGQVSDGFKEHVGAIVETDESHDIVKSEWSRRETTGSKAPIAIEKFSVGIFIDGIWKKKRQPNGEFVVSDEGGIEREYIPVSDEERKTIEQVVKNAVDFDISEGDKVAVLPLRFDRSKDFEAEDDAFRRRKLMAMIILISIAVVAVIIVLALVFRAIIRTREQIKRRREEELARKQAALRDAALRRAEEDSVNMQMAVGSKSVEDEEMAKQIARENPEDVANLIRTWLVEE